MQRSTVLLFAVPEAVALLRTYISSLSVFT
jgi:hypothetical protein